MVADGASDDGTLELLRSDTGLNIVISSQPDFGIYDALNRAIKISSGEYYIVAGGDDIFYADAIENYRAAILQSHADIIAASSKLASKQLSVKRGPSWIFGQASFIAGHTLATAFKKDLHQAFGEYSRKYPIASDQLFVLSACKGGASRHEAGFVAGETCEEGVSSIDRIGGATEVFRVQLSIGNSFLIQFILLILRILRIRLLRRSY